MQTIDFSRGKVWQNIVAQSIPLILAQLVQLLYNVVDRIYIGHLPGANSMALTGRGKYWAILLPCCLAHLLQCLWCVICFAGRCSICLAPVSNAIGGLACFVTMYVTLYRKLADRTSAG